MRRSGLLGVPPNGDAVDCGDPRSVGVMTTSPASTAATLAEDADAVLVAEELAQRLRLLGELAEHPSINRSSIARNRAEAMRLVDELKAHLLVVDFGA